MLFIALLCLAINSYFIMINLLVIEQKCFYKLMIVGLLVHMYSLHCSESDNEFKAGMLSLLLIDKMTLPTE